jgi:hypothetical protein
MSQANDTKRQRAIAIVVGSLIAAGIWFVLARGHGRAERVALEDNLPREVSQRISQQLAPRGLTAPELAAKPAAQSKLRVLTPEEVALALGQPDAGRREYDPLRFLRYSANLREVVDWPEYPGGRWTRVTNADGAREDHDFPNPPPDVFVLVAGDSHTEGACDNAASYSNLLELELANAHAGKQVEVYNTGMNGYSFYSYLGVLETFLARNPDVFVTTFFAGNDFAEVLRIQHLYDNSAAPPRQRGYWDEVAKGTSVSVAAMTQGLGELLYLRENPDQADLALQAASLATSEIQRICAEHGIDWIPVYLPSPLDLPLPEWAELRAEVKRALALSDADFELVNRLGDRLIATLHSRGVDVLDLRPIFRAESDHLYWSDLHIDLRGHQVVARELLLRVEAVLARRAEQKPPR